MLDWIRRDGDSSNTVIGIILLVMLLVFIGPNVLPSLLSRTFAFVDEGVPCTRLRQAEDRAFHQSLIGRATRNPLSLRVIPDDVSVDPTGIWTIRLVIENETIGSVPIVFNEREILLNDDGASSGFGLIFTQFNVFGTIGTRQPQGASIVDSSIRILGPRQRCVHRIEIPRNLIDANQINGLSAVSAYYRISTSGTLAVSGIYPDHGLSIIDGGFIQSEPVAIQLQGTSITAQ